MSIIRDDALILRSLRYGETSRLVVALTARHGKVHLLAKGAREPKRGYGGALEILTRSQIVFYHKRSRELHLVHSASVERAYLRILQTAGGFHLACAALEFVLRVVPDEDPAEEIFASLAAFLERADAADAPAPDGAPIDPRKAQGKLLWELRIFQLAVVAALGYAPATGCCCGCGAPLESEARFGVREGGLLCVRCRPEGEALPLSPRALALLRRICAMPGERMKAATQSESAGEEEAPKQAAAKEAAPHAGASWEPHASQGTGAVAERKPGGLRGSSEVRDRQVIEVVESFLRYHVTGYYGLKSLKSFAEWESLASPAAKPGPR
ncbi:MAG: DNA repair protein RecO [Candidatus Eisenbacteria bacterium]|nr:DNA repair protein RecO [Candidatus Eisenbacteria bacterium]